MTAATVAVGPTSLLALHRALHAGRRFGQFISARSRAHVPTRFQIRHSRVAVICRADVRRAFLDFFLDVSKSVSGAACCPAPAPGPGQPPAGGDAVRESVRATRERRYRTFVRMSNR